MCMKNKLFQDLKIIVGISIVLAVCTSCQNRSKTESSSSEQIVDTENVVEQEWLAYDPYQIEIDIIVDQKNGATSDKDEIQSILKQLKSIKLDKEIQNYDIPDGDGFGITLEYSNATINYAFLGESVRISSGDQGFRAFQIDNDVYNNLKQQVDKCANNEKIKCDRVKSMPCHIFSFYNAL